MPDIWVTATVLAKLALYLGIFGGAGTAIARLVFRLQTHVRMARAFAILGLAAAVAGFLLRGAMLTGDASGLRDPQMLGLLWSTPIGTALIYQIAGLGVLILGLSTGRTGLWLSVLGGVSAIWGLAYIGHIPDRQSWMLNATLNLHLIAVAFWIGVLAPLYHLASAPQSHAKAARLGHRFGQMAAIAVPLLIIAGGYMAYVLVGSPEALYGTGYGRTLIAKIILVGALLTLATANKLRFVPKLREGDPKAASHLRNAIMLEACVFLAILALTAVLTSSQTLPG